MGFINNLMRYVRGEDYEEDEVMEEEVPQEEPVRRWSPSERNDRYSRSEKSERAAERTVRSEARDYSANKVVNIHTVTQLSVVLVKPERYEQAADVADHLKDKRTVVLNLEQTNREIARRLLDFLSGVAYANEGKIKKVANSTYIITPYNVDIQGDIIDELENNGLYL
ncbi:MAG: cell division protein SepF [Eubacteriales bacterium]|jgi:cell division inhibitor SepF